MRAVTVLSLAAVLAGTPVQARTSVEQEFRSVLFRIAQYVDGYYFEKLPADSLMHAAARGIFRSLDPSSEYQLAAADTSLGANFSTLMQVTQAVADSALYAVPPDTLIRFGVAGMMEILDPYTVFMEDRNLADFNIQTQGHYGGLGFRIQIVYPDSAIAVWQLLHETTPAARAGVRSGDLIVAIDGQSTRKMTAGDAADSMRGPPGTPVTLSLTRAGVAAPFDITIIREEVQMESVSLQTMFADSTGYIKLVRFQSDSGEEVARAIESLRRQGMSRLILDLRGNGGGYLKEAISVSELFLPRDRLVVFTAGRALRDTTRYSTQKEPLAGDEPLIVMVDRQSASASEIVAGAIQDWDRGLVLGSPTVGKGSVQQTVRISDTAELKLTMAAWHTPSGRSIDRRMRKDSTLTWESPTSYTTRVLGRTVHGGGGITPDVPAQGRKATPLFHQLNGWQSLNSQFFYFARQYHLQHPRVTAVFRADDAVLQQFRTFAAERGFDYVSEAEAPLGDLRGKVAQDSGFVRLERPLTRLLAEIDRMEEDDWRENAPLLEWKLTYDILEKNLGVRAALTYDVTVDPQIIQARRILASPAEYASWFARPEIGAAADSLARDDAAVEME
jgi:carboxyl-terminal processing protease